MVDLSGKKTITNDDINKYLFGERGNALTVLWENVIDNLPAPMKEEAKLKGFSLVDVNSKSGNGTVRHMCFKIRNPSEQLQATYDALTEIDRSLALVVLTEGSAS